MGRGKKLRVAKGLHCSSADYDGFTGPFRGLYLPIKEARVKLTVFLFHPVPIGRQADHLKGVLEQFLQGFLRFEAKFHGLKGPETYYRGVSLASAQPGSGSSALPSNDAPCSSGPPPTHGAIRRATMHPPTPGPPSCRHPLQNGGFEEVRLVAHSHQESRNVARRRRLGERVRGGSHRRQGRGVVVQARHLMHQVTRLAGPDCRP